MKKPILLLLLFFSFGLLCAQSSVELSYKKADSLFQQALYDKALHVYEKEVDKFKLSQQWEAYVLGRNKIALCYSRLGEYLKAQQILGSGLNIIEEKKIQNHALKSSIYSELGEIDLNEGDFESAILHFEKEAALFDKATQSHIRATNKNNLGLAQSQMGNFYTALEHLKQGLFLYKESNNTKGIGDSYNNIGLLYASKDSKQALENYSLALTHYQKSVGEKHPAYLNTLNNQAIIYRSNGETDKAINIFEEVLKRWKTIYGIEHPNVAFTYSNIGQVYLGFNMPDTALAYQQKALNIYKKTYGSFHPEIANTYNHMANIHRTLREYDLAIQETQWSMAANCPDFRGVAEYDLPDAKSSCLNRQLLAVTIHLKAQLFIDRHYNKTLKIADLKYALETLKRCDEVIEIQRHLLKSKSDKISLGKLAAEVYEDGISTAFALSQNSVSHKKEYLTTAFHLCEKSKAAVLLESIADANAKSFANIPEAVTAKEAKFVHLINALSQELVKQDDPIKREALLNETKAYEQFIAQLEKDYPDYFALKYSVKLADVTNLQKNLDEKTMVLSYFVAESGKRLYIFKIGQKHFSVINASLLPTFDNQITGFRNAIFYSGLKTYLQTGHTLYKQLFPKHLSPHISKLIILPDGRLNIIPFEALITKKVKPELADYTSLPYLINDYEVAYNFSATLYLQSLKKAIKSTNPQVMLNAPVTFEGLPSLPGTLEEVEGLTKIFKSSGIVPSAHIYDNATETSLKSNDLDKYDYLHLATHGIVNERYPELSQIYLKKDPNNDGNLFTGEIYTLKLKAKLVTLSACETGLGQLSRGEGIVGLSRSLMFAGAENMVVSYWPVADKSTSQLMISFYTHLMKDPSQHISKSLRQAKIELVQSKKFTAPYYWAPFVLIGN